MSMKQMAEEYGRTIELLAQRETALRRAVQENGDKPEPLVRRQMLLREELRDLRRIHAHLLQYLRRVGQYV